MVCTWCAKSNLNWNLTFLALLPPVPSAMMDPWSRMESETLPFWLISTSYRSDDVMFIYRSRTVQFLVLFTFYFSPVACLFGIAFDVSPIEFWHFEIVPVRGTFRLNWQILDRVADFCFCSALLNLDSFASTFAPCSTTFFFEKNFLFEDLFHLNTLSVRWSFNWMKLNRTYILNLWVKLIDT